MNYKKQGIYKIGEAAKICGVSRKSLLVYEEAGALIPSVKDPVSGFRYYTSEDITRLLALKKLQSLGLSLQEIAEYFGDPAKIENCIARQEKLRSQLDNSIRELKRRAVRETAQPSERSIEHIVLPEQVCFSLRAANGDFAELSGSLKAAHILAMNSGFIQTVPSLMTLWLGKSETGYDVMHLVTMNQNFKGTERVVLEETPAISIIYRGPYEKLSIVVNVLQKYAAENRLTAAGPIRTIWLEGPSVLGSRPELYLTNVALPVKEAVC